MTSNDTPPETPDEARARRRAEVPPPGSVQEEAALLVDLLSQRGWGPSPGMPAGGAAGAGVRGTAADEAGAGRTTGDAAGGGARDAGAAGGGETNGRAGADQGQHECTCGGRTPAACKVCPVCQLIAVVQNVSPETIEKVADFVGFAATALRDLATAQRERRTSPDGSGDDEGSPDGETSR